MKIYLISGLLLMGLCSCVPFKIQLIEERREQIENEVIINTFKEPLIIKAYEKLDVNIFDIAKWYNEYIKTETPTFEGFYRHQLQYRYPFIDPYYWEWGGRTKEEVIEEYLQSDQYRTLKANYELLKRMEESNGF